MARLSNGTAARPNPKPVNPRRTEAASTPAITKARLKVMDVQKDPGRSRPIMSRPVRAVHRSPAREPGWLERGITRKWTRAQCGARTPRQDTPPAPACRMAETGGLRRFLLEQVGDARRQFVNQKRGGVLPFQVDLVSVRHIANVVFQEV